jgi:hypothetical protein
LKVVLQNSTIRGFSYIIIVKEVRKRGYEIVPRIIWKVLTATGYSQCKLTVKPGLNELNMAERLAWYLEREYWILEE